MSKDRKFKRAMESVSGFGSRSQLLDSSTASHSGGQGRQEHFRGDELVIGFLCLLKLGGEFVEAHG